MLNLDFFLELSKWKRKIVELKNLFSTEVCSHNNLLKWKIIDTYFQPSDPKVEHHACANLEHLFLYSQHFSANAQGVPRNYFRLLEKHGRELVWTLIGIVQTIGVVMALPQRLLFISEVHVACCDMHNGGGIALVLQGWGESNFFLQRWKFDLRGSTSEVFSLGAFGVSPTSASFHSSCQFLLRFLTQSLQLSYHISPHPVSHPPMLARGELTPLLPLS